MRQAVFASYGRDWQDAGECFDPASADRWGKAYDWYLRGWLPARRDVAIADLGCGQGRLLHWLKTRSYTRRPGVHMIPDQVAVARQVVPSVDAETARGFRCRHRCSSSRGTNPLARSGSRVNRNFDSEVYGPHLLRK
ncbi:MAG TPA: hypothetical protein VNL18_05700 [Gemmatimonadales bacterium]|nr:hypothetical protein [Gemmatimonadales bacterium]